MLLPPLALYQHQQLNQDPILLNRNKNIRLVEKLIQWEACLPQYFITSFWICFTTNLSSYCFQPDKIIPLIDPNRSSSSRSFWQASKLYQEIAFVHCRDVGIAVSWRFQSRKQSMEKTINCLCKTSSSTSLIAAATWSVFKRLPNNGLWILAFIAGFCFSTLCMA